MVQHRARTAADGNVALQVNSVSLICINKCYKDFTLTNIEEELEQRFSAVAVPKGN